MAVVVLVLLLSASALLSSTEAQTAYNNLSEPYKKGVDLALEQLNSHTSVRLHFLFFKSITISDIEAGFGVSYLYHNFYLKATKCNKGTVNPNPSNCAFRNDRPLIDCAACYKTFEGEIQKDPVPYIHCVHKPALTQGMKSDREKHCSNMAYSRGTATLLASTKDNY